MEQDATEGQPTDAEAGSAPPEEPTSTSAAEEHAGGPVEMAKEKLEEVKEKIAPKLEEAKEKIGPKIEEAGNKAKPAFGKVKDMVQNLLNKLRKKPADCRVSCAS